MDALHIRALETRLHLKPSQMGEERRLAAALREVLDEGLELALARLGVPLHEEICIREIHAPVNLRLSAASAELAVDWSLALAEGLERALRGCGPGVVRYPTPIHALVDFALGVAFMDLSRAWAWRQMGLADVHPGVTPAQASDHLVIALEREASAIVPVLSAVADHGALATLFQRLPPDAWPRLATQVLDAAGAGVAWGDIERACAAPTDPLDSPESARIARALVRSGIARAARRSSGQIRASLANRQAVAVLALLEADRGLLYRGLAEVARWVAVAVGELRADHVAGSGPPEPPPAGRRAQKEPSAGFDSHLNDRAAVGPVATAPAEATSNQGEKTPGAAASHRAKGERPADLRGREPLPETAAPEESLAGVHRQRGLTGAGGLLFLLAVLSDLDLPRAMVASELGRQRTLPWLLHRLALTLAEVQEHDAAALAFAGLGPEEEPPSRSEAPPTSAETAQLREWCRHVEGYLARRLAGQQDLLAWVCRRRAEIVADPGWIEVHLSLGEVSTEIRRAGLDLDPGYLPWLGVVFKFIYRQPW